MNSEKTEHIEKNKNASKKAIAASLAAVSVAAGIMVTTEVAHAAPVATTHTFNNTNTASTSVADHIDPARLIHVQIEVDGVTRRFRMTKDSTVGTLLTVAGVTVSPKDSVSAKLDSPLKSNEKVVVLHHATKTFVSVHAIPFTTVTQGNPVSCSSSAHTMMVKKGKAGYTRNVYVLPFVGGHAQKPTLSSTQTVKPVNEVIAQCIVKTVGASTQASTPVAKTSQSTTASNNRYSATVVKTVAKVSAPVKTVTAPKTVVSVSSVTGTKTQWMAAAGIPSSQWGYVDYIISHESGWNPRAINASSGACSLVQALPCSKLGANWSDPVTALKWFKQYCQDSYGSIENAYAFWVSHHWY